MPDLLVDALAAYRLTRLLQRDDITARQRMQIRRLVAHGWLPDWAETLMGCPWCLGFWISCSVVLARHLAPRRWSSAASVLSLSALVGMIDVILGDDGD